MGEDESLEVKFARLEEKVIALLEREKSRAGREWAIISAVGGLLLTIIASKLGIMTP